LKPELKFIHQTGKADLETVRAGYQSRHFDADVVEVHRRHVRRYAKERARHLPRRRHDARRAHRLQEGRVLVPFPFATDDHQAVNASALVNAAPR